MVRERKKVRRDLVRTRVETEASGSNFDSYLNTKFEMFKPSRKKIIDVIPYEVTKAGHPDRAEIGDLMPSRPFFVHKGIGDDDKTIVCPKSFGKPCPICKDFNAQNKDPDCEWDDYKHLQPKSRDLFFLKEKKEGTYKIWDISFYLFTKQLNEEILEEEDYDLYADTEEGFTLNIRFEEKAFNGHSYFNANRIDFKPRGPLSDEDLDEAEKLDDILIVLPYADIEALYLGGSIDVTETKKDDDVDEDEKEAKKTKKDKEVKDTKETKETKKDKEVKEDKSSNKCPHGHKFGDEYDETEDCDGCENWDACSEAFDDLPF